MPSLTGPQGGISAMFVMGALLAMSTLLLPNASDVMAALRRAKPLTPAPVVSPASAMTGAPARTSEALASLFAQGQTLQPAELRQLLAWSTRSGTAATLGAIATRLGQQEPVPTVQVAYDLLAAGRPAVAMAFLEGRPERDAPATWRLRLELHLQAHDLPFAQEMVRHAAVTRGAVPTTDFVQGAYAAGLPGALLSAAEHRVIPPLDAARSLDLARQAQASGRFDLIARIDRAGTPGWRSQDPWLAMAVAQHAGDVAGALHYAALLPQGAAAARRSIIIASHDRQAIRAMLLEEGRADPAQLPSAAQQLLDTGFRADAIALLQQGCTRCAPDDAQAARLLFLMGPRPPATGLAWLRMRAETDSRWIKPYVNREAPGAALAFLQSRPDADATPVLLDRLALAVAARDRAGAGQALDRLLDGRPLSAAQAGAVTAASPPWLDRKTTLALSRMRVRSGAELPGDRLDLAWDGWNRGDMGTAQENLLRHLSRKPDDAAALRLMAEIERRRAGDRGARPWLEKALAATPGATADRARLLEQIGRLDEALVLVRGLRQSTPHDRRLQAMEGRLLVASGDPGRARKELQP
jgi:tetratricopeptide (TPR) repeat protein